MFKAGDTVIADFPDGHEGMLGRGFVNRESYKIINITDCDSRTSKCEEAQCPGHIIIEGDTQDGCFLYRKMFIKKVDKFQEHLERMKNV